MSKARKSIGLLAAAVGQATPLQQTVEPLEPLFGIGEPWPEPKYPEANDWRLLTYSEDGNLEELILTQSEHAAGRALIAERRAAQSNGISAFAVSPRAALPKFGTAEPERPRIESPFDIPDRPPQLGWDLTTMGEKLADGALKAALDLELAYFKANAHELDVFSVIEAIRLARRTWGPDGYQRGNFIAAFCRVLGFDGQNGSIPADRISIVDADSISESQ